MEALLAFVRESSLPKTVRADVASEPVCSVTVGAVDKRSDGYGISAATLLHRGYFMRLLHNVVQDAGLRGSAPPFYTSVCLNVGFAARFHVDSRNEGRSFIVSGGDYTGGELFCEGPGDDVWHAEEELNVQGRAIRAGAAVTGTDYDIRRSWFQFDGSILHAVRPFAGERVNIVYFRAPRQKITAALSSKLRALGFPLPVRPLCALRWPSPYHIYICSTRRSGTIAHHTLRVLFQDASIAPEDVTLCVRDGVDVGSYMQFGLNIIVDEVAAQETPTFGLPEQRRLCLVGRSHGSWNLFVDDDVISIHRLESTEWMSLHDLILLGFLTAEQEDVRLWGCNSSGDARNLRDNVSHGLGLICGYFWGVFHDAKNPTPKLSDAVQGAGEDIERSLRFYHGGGIVRINFACAQAKTWCNDGGLQESFANDRRIRESAHDYVVLGLCREYPELLIYDPSRPNRCSFRSACSAATVAPRKTQQESKERPPKEKQPHQRSLQCGLCEKVYRRAADLRHHMLVQHTESAPRHACPNCGRLFLKAKDMKAHVRGMRCGSKRGRYRPWVPEMTEVAGVSI